MCQALILQQFFFESPSSYLIYIITLLPVRLPNADHTSVNSGGYDDRLIIMTPAVACDLLVLLLPGFAGAP